MNRETALSFCVRDRVRDPVGLSFFFFIASLKSETVSSPLATYFLLSVNPLISTDVCCYPFCVVVAEKENKWIKKLARG